MDDIYIEEFKKILAESDLTTSIYKKERSSELIGKIPKNFNVDFLEDKLSKTTQDDMNIYLQNELKQYSVSPENMLNDKLSILLQVSKNLSENSILHYITHGEIEIEGVSVYKKTKIEFSESKDKYIKNNISIKTRQIHHWITLGDGGIVDITAYFLLQKKKEGSYIKDTIKYRRDNNNQIAEHIIKGTYKWDDAIYYGDFKKLKIKHIPYDVGYSTMRTYYSTNSNELKEWQKMYNKLLINTFGFINLESFQTTEVEALLLYEKLCGISPSRQYKRLIRQYNKEIDEKYGPESTAAWILKIN